MEYKIQQHGSKYFAHCPLRPQGYWFKRSKFIFSEHGHVAYQLKGSHNSALWKHTFCPQTPNAPCPNLGMRSIAQKLTYSEHGHVAYKIKWNHKM